MRARPLSVRLPPPHCFWSARTRSRPRMDGAITVKGVEEDVAVRLETVVENLDMTLAELSRAKVRPEATGEE